MPNNELKISDVTFSFHKRVIYQQANLNLVSDGVYGLVGPNGAGKTTLFNLITGLLKQQSGKMMLAGQVITPSLVFKQISYIQDSSVLYPYLTGRDLLTFIAKQHHVLTDKVVSMCQLMEINPFIDLPTKSLSLGQKQRLLIALGLLPNARVILMDEPLNGLDPDSVIVIRELLRSLNKRHKLVIVSSHNLDELSKVTEKIIFKTEQSLLLEERLTNAEARYAELYQREALWHD